MAQFAVRVAPHDAEIARRASFITCGYEYRMIECEITYHTPKQAMKTIVRLDTGEVVKEKAMEAKELRECLKFEQQEAANNPIDATIGIDEPAEPAVGAPEPATEHSK